MKVRHIEVQESDRLLTPEEVAERLGVTLRWVRRAVAEKRLKVVKVGRLNRFRESFIDEFIEFNTSPAYDDED
jgi:excisionase family DNA binding protein